MAFAFNATAPVRSTDNFYETEEERQRRLAQEARLMPSPAAAQVAQAPVTAPVTPASVTPVKQTITTDPVTGERRIKIEGSERDLSAANALTPTLVPAQPQMTELPPSIFPAGVNPQDMRLAQGTQASPGQMPQLTATTPQLQPAAQPVAEQMPVAAPAPVAPVAAPVAPTTVAPAPVAAAPVAARLEPGQVDWDTILTGSAVNDRIGLKMLQDPNTPVMYRMAANSNLRDQTKEKKDIAEAKSTAEQIMQSGDSRAFEREMKKEGSLLKAVFFGALGAKDIARNELDKLGYGAGRWETVTDPTTGKQSLIKYRTDGMPMEGFDQNGAALTSKQLAAASGVKGAQKLGIVGGTYVNDRTGEVGRVVSDERTGVSYVQTDTGRKPMTGFRPQASAGTLGDMNTRQLQELGNKLAFAGPNASAAEREKIIAESEAKFGLLPEAYKAQVRGAAPQPPAAAPAAVAPAAAAPVAVAPAAAAPVAPVVPSAAAPAAGRPAAGGGGGSAAGGAAGAVANQTPAQREAALATQQAAAAADIQRRKEMQLALEKPAAAAAGVDAATTVKNQAFADRSYSLMKPIDTAIRESTGSGIGAAVDTLASQFGKGTKGAQAIAKLNVLSYGILANIPRFEGPQSDIDVQMYKQAAGDFANNKAPVEVRLAALQALNGILQRYDAAGKNDWTFGKSAEAAAGAGTTSSGNKYKRIP